MKVAALTRGKTVPSSRYRVRQCLPALAGLGIDVTEYCPAFSQNMQLPGPLGHVRRRYVFPALFSQILLNFITRIPGTLGSHFADLVWISRGFLPGMNRFVRLTRGPRVLDVDDAIWLSEPLGPAQAIRNAQRMDVVVVGNSFLANWYESHCRKIEIIPTSVDCLICKPLPKRNDSEHFTVGWIGTSGNHRFLHGIFDTIKLFLDDHPKSRLLIISDRRPEWLIGDSNKLVFRRWSSDREVEDLNMMDVGLMPLQDSDWTRGKCSFKMLQYMAVSKPVIVSPVGMNNEVLNLGDCGMAANSNNDWYEALSELYQSPDRSKIVGQTGRSIVQKYFDTEVVAQRYAKVFSDLVGENLPLV